jgi:carbon-monoxide dehydrogenase small subunit/xanthine dehydrogenase small subunit
VNLDEALRILEAQGDNVTIVAGATDLLTNLKLGLVHPGTVMDISQIDGLADISRRNGVIEIGGATPVSAIAGDPLVASHLPALAQAAALFGADAIRNRATLGGNLVTASPAADLPPPLMALDATVVLASTNRRREVPIDAFFTAYRQTMRQPNELLVGVRVPVPPEGIQQAFYKVGTRRAQAISKISLAGRARLDATGKVIDVRIAAGSVAPIPVRLRKVEQSLEGSELHREAIQRAGELASDEVTPIDDVRSTEHYRRTITGRLVSRFLREISTD